MNKIAEYPHQSISLGPVTKAKSKQSLNMAAVPALQKKNTVAGVTVHKNEAFQTKARLQVSVPVLQNVKNTSSIQKKEGVIQRAVVLLDDNVNDYALIKTLIGLGRANTVKVPANSANWNAAGGDEYIIPYSLLKNEGWRGLAEREKEENPTMLLQANETIYVVGHGQPGVVWTKPDHEGEVSNFGDVVEWLKEILPDDWAGEIKLMNCNSTISPGGKKKSVAEKISGEFNEGKEDDEEKIIVSGQAGFAYGMGDGTMAVLKSEFDELYKAKDGDRLSKDTIDHLVSKAKQIEKSKLTELINFSVKGYSKSELENHVPSFFIAKKVAIEARLKEIVEADRSIDIYMKKTALSNNHEFMGLITKQKTLFASFDLWNADGEIAV